MTGLLLVLLLAFTYVGVRSLFVGGWHDSGDHSYACPASPWHTYRNPLPSSPWGQIHPGLGTLCNRDAREAVWRWSIAEFVATGGVAASLIFAGRKPRARAVVATGAFVVAGLTVLPLLEG